MSNARGYGQNGQALYSNITKPILSFLNFTVTPTNGLGVTSVASNGYVNNVFMHTSTTPAAGNGLTNPNPIAGYALIQMKQNLNKFLGMQACWTVPTATSTAVDTAALTVGQVYVITILGTTTVANWRLLGVPAGVTPAVGVAFTALITGTSGSPGTSTSRVQLPSTSGIDLVEVVGVTNVGVTSTIASQGGQWLALQFSKAATVMTSYTPAGTITVGAYTPAGTNSAPALTMNSYTPAGTNNGDTPPLFAGTPATLTGTVAAPTFTGSAASLTATFAGTPATLVGTTSQVIVAPTTGSICQLQLWFDGSSVTIDGL